MEPVTADKIPESQVPIHALAGFDQPESDLFFMTGIYCTQVT
ncbi:hypothetical protein OHAE_2245 [Ochrobactrum soli]|uniref:Uncharacterized protein n=1 Tax=Ochrobactrum soli TaxID=2448455 RepID=A0A2P9HQI3_9HYPH|nr:hypothetical protein OHAE_2245 [[Ochrobactrum] soli]